MAKTLTPLSVQNAKPRRRDGNPTLTEISDAGCRALRLVVHPTGHKSWIVRYRHGGKSRKMTLGAAIVMRPGEADPPNALTLAAARKQATDALHRLAQGYDPAVEKRAAQQPANVETFASVAEACFGREAKRLRSADRLLHELRRLAFPSLGSKPIASIKRSDVVKLLDAIETEKGPVMGDLVLAAISKVMHDHARRSDDYVPPLVRGMQRAKGKERARVRVLSDDELRAMWTATSEGIFGAYVRFLLLTGCRRNEAAFMPWSEISNGNAALWALPGARNKTKVELVRPLSQGAQAILAQLPRTPDTELVFQRMASKFAKGKRALDKASGVSNWTLHDLRRTARSLMSRAGVPDHHAERCLGHVILGVKGVYDRHRYVPEMLAAYEKLAALIDNIVNPQPNVVPMVRG